MKKEIKPVLAWACLKENGQIDKEEIYSSRDAARSWGFGKVIKVEVKSIK